MDLASLMDRAPRALLLLAGLSATLAACHATGFYRSVDLPHPHAASRIRVEQELREKGYRIQSSSSAGGLLKLRAVARTPAPADAAPARPTDVARTPAPTRAAPERPTDVAATPTADATTTRPAGVTATPTSDATTTHPAGVTATPTADATTTHPAAVARPQPRPRAIRAPPGASITALLSPREGGTRALVHASGRQTIDPIFAQSKHTDYKVSFGLNGERLLWELHGATGYRYAPTFGHSLAIEAGARIGYRVGHLGGGEERHRAALTQRYFFPFQTRSRKGPRPEPTL